MRTKTGPSSYDCFLVPERGGRRQSPRGGRASAPGEGEALPERGAGASGEEEGEFSSDTHQHFL